MKNLGLNRKLKSADEVAKYIFHSDAEQESYALFIEEGNDPRDHVLYHAAVVLDCDREFCEDIEAFEKANA